MNHIYDFTEDEAKQASRGYNLTQVMRCPHLFNSHDGLLLHDWAELPGIGAPTYQLLRERGWFRQNRFLGPERDEAVYQALCQTLGQNGEQHEFFHQAMHHWIKTKHAENVGVCNYDSLHVARDSRFRERLGELWAWALEQAECLGNFALILNVGLQRGGSLAEFRQVLLDVGGHTLDESHLRLPGVLYQGRKSPRINYAVLFGRPIKQERTLT